MIPQIVHLLLIFYQQCLVLLCKATKMDLDVWGVGTFNPPPETA